MSKMMMDKQVVVSVKVKGDPSDNDDEDVPGNYQVEATIFDAPHAPALTLAQAEAVREAALDAFHEKIGIACLDDFTIDVSFSEQFEAAGIDTPEPTAEEVAAVDVQAVFVGRIE